MFEDKRIEKVQILIKQSRYTDAEKLLSDLLNTDPNDIHLLALLAEVNLQQDNLGKAYKVIDNAIGLSPDNPYLFYIKSRIAIEQDNFTEAERSINQSILLDANDASYYAVMANIKLLKKQFEEALEIANRALGIDAENLLALNTRSTALTKLNRSEEAFATIEGALREDPNNAYTHTNYGWGLLEKGDHKKALEHFKEALANDPNYDVAQLGILEAIKAANPLYRLFLKFAFFMSNLTSKYQWGVIIGFYIVFRILRTVAKNNEALQPFLTPIIVTLALLAFSTWIITPISNLFLRFNKYGQLLLDEKEKMSSNFVIVSLGLCLFGLLLYFVMSDEKMLTIAFFGFAMMVPLGTMFSPTKNKNRLLIYTIILAIIGVISITMTFITGKLFNPLTFAFIIGFVAFQWVANYMLIKEDNH